MSRVQTSKNAINRMLNKEKVRKFIDFITYVNHPLKIKFALFSFGVLFWFLAIYIMSMATLFYINKKSNNIVNYTVAQDRTAQKIIRKLERVHYATDEIMHISDSTALVQTNKASMRRLEDARSFTSALASGGQINDYSRDSESLLDSYSVASVKGDTEGEKIVAELSAKIAATENILDEMTDLKLNALRKNTSVDSKLEEKLQEFDQLIFSALTLAHNFSVAKYKEYSSDARDISKANACTMATISIVLFISSSLLLIFTIWISRSIAVPVESIIDQIRSLGEGTIDLSKKIEITSKDEIGVLSREFNGLMDSIHGMKLYKKIIEEDESLQDVYSRLAEIFKNSLGFNEFIIYEVSNSQNKMKPVHPIALSETEMNCNFDILDNCYLCRAKKTGNMVSSIEYPDVCKYFLHNPDKDYLCIPMLVGGSTGGVVQFSFVKAHRSESDLNELNRRIFRAGQYIKESISVIEAKRLMSTLKDSSLQDSLTGLYNRRFLQEYTENLVAGVVRRGKNIGLLMCDLDYFKQVNDIYGHNTGDTVLKETAEILKNSVRNSDLVIRFGGEEFLVVLIDINDGESISVAEKIRESIEHAKIKVPDGIIMKTISIGISEFPRDTEGFWQAIKFADVALYEAKSAGRNRIVKFTQELWKQEQF